MPLDVHAFMRIEAKAHRIGPEKNATEFQLHTIPCSGLQQEFDIVRKHGAGTLN